MLHINHKLALLLYYVLISFLITSCSQSDQKMQWALENNGQDINGSIGIKGIDIEYMNTEPSTKATIAIIDSGFINSPYLKEQIFINVGEIKDDGIDNDGNPLNKSYSYNEDIPSYIDFLETGMKNYRK